MQMKMVPIIIGNSYNAYGIMRSFADAGIKPILVMCGKRNFIGYSKYALKSIVVTDPGTSEHAFIEDLIALGKDLLPQKGILYPTHDEQLLSLANNSELLCEYYELPFSSYETLLKIMDKSSFNKLCESLDIPTIKEMRVSSREEAINCLTYISFPLIVKDVIFDVSTKRKHTSYCYSYEEYEVIINSIYDSDNEAHLLIQEFIDSSDVPMPNVNSVTDREGNMQCVFVSEKIRQFPVKTGTSTATLSVDPENHKYDRIVEYTKRITKELSFYGLFGVEYIFDKRDGEYKIIEMNPRSEFPNYLQTLVGQNMPVFLYFYHQDIQYSIPFYPVIKNAFCFVQFSDYFNTVFINRINHNDNYLPASEWKKTIVKPYTKYGVTRKDILPYLGGYFRGFKQGVATYIREKNNIPSTISLLDYYKRKLK